MVFPCMVNELALYTAQVRSMVFTCMVDELALSPAHIWSMVFTCMVMKSFDSTGKGNSNYIYCN